MADRAHSDIRETSTTGGTGNQILAGAFDGSYRTFASKYADGDKGFAVFRQGALRELSEITYSAGANSLSRSVIWSTNANSLVNFAAGQAIDIFDGLPGPSDLNDAQLGRLAKLFGAVGFSAVQVLTAVQQRQARENIGAGYLSYRNKLLNSGFSYWQRGTSSSITSVSNVYTADRWFVTLNQRTSGTLVVARNTLQVEAGYAQCIEINCSALVTTQIVDLKQIMPTVEVAKCQGLPMTFTARMKANSGTPTASISIIDGTNSNAFPNTNTQTVSNNCSLSTSYADFSVTKTIQAGANSIACIISTPSSFSGVIYVEFAQAEPGSVATPYERIPNGLNELNCDEFYQKIKIPEFRGYNASNGNVLSMSIGLRRKMRGNPSSSSIVTQPSTIFAAGSLGISAASDEHIVYSVTGTGTGQLFWSGDGVAALDCELS